MSKKNKTTSKEKQAEQVARAKRLHEQIEELLLPGHVQISEDEGATENVADVKPELSRLSPRDFIQKRMAEMNKVDKKGEQTAKAKKKKRRKKSE